jgi:hypothetical protein
VTSSAPTPTSGSTAPAASTPAGPKTARRSKPDPAPPAGRRADVTLGAAGRPPDAAKDVGQEAGVGPARLGMAECRVPGTAPALLVAPDDGVVGTHATTLVAPPSASARPAGSGQAAPRLTTGTPPRGNPFKVASWIRSGSWVTSTVNPLAVPSRRIAATPSSIEAWRKPVVRVNTSTAKPSRPGSVAGAGRGAPSLQPTSTKMATTAATATGRLTARRPERGKCQVRAARIRRCRACRPSGLGSS